MMPIAVLSIVISSYLLSFGKSAPAVQSSKLSFCEEARKELARFSNYYTAYGSTTERDPYAITQHSTPAGETFSTSRMIFLSKSRFKKAARRLSEDPNVIERSPIIDAKGHEVGQRLVAAETRSGKPVTHIWLITDRMIKGIVASTLNLALTIEKSETNC